MLPAPRRIAKPESTQDGNGAKHAAHHVIHRRPGAERPPRRAGHVSKARLHLHHLIQGSAVFIRAGQIALKRTIDQPRVARRKRLIAQALGCKPARAEILHHHIRRINQALQGFQIASIIRIYRHTFLVAAESGEESGAGCNQIACAITLARGFYFDHLGPQIGQHQAASGPHNHVGEFNNANSGERKRIHGGNLRAG